MSAIPSSLAESLVFPCVCRWESLALLQSKDVVAVGAPMKLKELVHGQIRDHDLCPGAVTVDDWMDKKWLTAKLDSGVVKVLPVWGVKNALSMHDMHHVLTDYDTSVDGEIELAAWELGSGGCGYNPLLWIDRLLLAAYGLLVRRSLTTAAFQRGKGCSNLFGRKLAEVLELEVASLKRELGL